MITTKDIEHIANLSRLEFNKEEIETFKDQMNSIVDYVNELEQIDTTGVEFEYQSVDAKNGLRPDVARPFFTPEQATKNAPNKKNGTFVVPSVLE